MNPPVSRAMHLPSHSSFTPSPLSDRSVSSSCDSVASRSQEFSRPACVDRHGLPAPALAGSPSTGGLEDSRQRALEALAAAGRAQEAAAGVGVQVAKASFLARWASLVLSCVSFTLAAAATVATAGAAAPVLAVASYYLLQSAGDAWCAWRCWQDEQQRQVDPSHKMSLPMGGGAVGNLLYFAAEGLGCNPEQAQAVARRGATLATALAAVLGVFAGTTAPAVAAELVVTRLAGSSVQALLQPFETLFPIVRKQSVDTDLRLAQAQAEHAVCTYLVKRFNETTELPDAVAKLLKAEVPSLLEPALAGEAAHVDRARQTLAKQLEALVQLGQERALAVVFGHPASAGDKPYASLHPEPAAPKPAAVEAEALRMGSRGLVMASALRSVVLSAMALRG